MKSCPSLQQLSAMAGAEVNSDLQAHLSLCEACTGALAEFSELKALSQALPYEVASDQEKARRHRTVMSAVAAPAPRRSLAYFGPMLAAAAVGLLVIGAGQFLSSESSPSMSGTHELRASVQASDGAVFSHYVLQGSDGPQEVVELLEGDLELDTLALSGRAFTLKVHKGSIQAEQGRMLVSVSRGRLIQLAVISGQAQWVRTDAPTLHLSAGAKWQAAQDSVSKAPALSGQEQLFQEGMGHAESGAFADAAEAFSRARVAFKGQAMAEDATYWWAVSEGRAGHKAAAIKALGLYMETYPESARACEVAVMLGWLVLEQGHNEQALGLFKVGLQSDDPEIQSSAKRGLGASS
jgi:TolA-binding protein